MRWPQFHKKIKPVASSGHISLGWLCRPTAPGNPLGVEEGGEKSICHLSIFCLSLVSLTSPPTHLLPLVIRYSCYLVHPGSPGKSVPPPPTKQNPSTLSWEVVGGIRTMSPFEFGWGWVKALPQDAHLRGSMRQPPELREWACAKTVQLSTALH